jgi:hypothetical protein
MSRLGIEQAACRGVEVVGRGLVVGVRVVEVVQGLDVGVVVARPGAVPVVVVEDG